MFIYFLFSYLILIICKLYSPLGASVIKHPRTKYIHPPHSEGKTAEQRYLHEDNPPPHYPRTPTPGPSCTPVVIGSIKISITNEM